MDPMGIYSYIVDELKLSFLVRRWYKVTQQDALVNGKFRVDCLGFESFEYGAFLLVHLFHCFPFLVYFADSRYICVVYLYSCLFIYVSLPFIWKCRSIPHWVVVQSCFNHNRTEGRKQERFVVHKVSYTVILQLENAIPWGSNHLLRMAMKPKYYAEEVMGHPNRYLRIWLDA